MAAKKYGKFTFKTEKGSGPYASFFHYSTDIKLKGFKLGYIDPHAPHKIHLMVYKSDEDKAKPTNNPNCPWKWVSLRNEFATLEEAKEWVQANNDQIQAHYGERLVTSE